MSFRYLRDPLFLVCVALYSCSRGCRELGLHHPWFDGYFNDVLCVGV